MTPDRMDALLEGYLASGALPDGVSAEEREELVLLAERATTLRTTAPDTTAEASVALPTARARFERFVAASRVPAGSPRTSDAREPAVRRRSLPQTIGVGLAALLLVAVVAFGASQLIDDRGVHTAHALEPGDYAQIEGVVTVAEDRGSDVQIRVATAIGNVTVNATEATSVVDADDAVPLSTVQRGMTVAVGGLVTDNRQIAARSVAVGETSDRPPLKAVPRRVRAEDSGLQGRIAVLSLAEDGTTARIVVTGEADRLYVAAITGESAAALVALERPLGAVVRVVQGPAGTFEATIVEPAEPDTPIDGPDATVAPGRPDDASAEAPALVSIRGVVVSVSDRSLSMRTRRGLVTVEFGEGTRVVPAGASLSQDALEGHIVVVRGGLAESGSVRADVLLVGRKVSR